MHKEAAVQEEMNEAEIRIAFYQRLSAVLNEKTVMICVENRKFWRQTSWQNLFKSTLGGKLAVYIPCVCLSGQTNVRG